MSLILGRESVSNIWRVFKSGLYLSWLTEERLLKAKRLASPFAFTNTPNTFSLVQLRWVLS